MECWKPTPSCIPTFARVSDAAMNMLAGAKLFISFVASSTLAAVSWTEIKQLLPK